jgi:hypothetical protein
LVFLLALGAVVALFLCLSARPRALMAAGPPVRYVAPAPIGSDSGNDCARSYAPCATVQHAIGEADAGDEIRVAAGLYVGTVILDQDLVLRGGFTTTNWFTPDPDQNSTIIDAQRMGRVISVPASISATVSGFHLTGGRVENDRGGGVYNNGTLALTGSRIYGNEVITGGDGGGVASGSSLVSATLVLRDCQVYSNAAGLLGGGLGGGVDVYSGTALIEATEIFSNYAENYAGGVVVRSGKAVVRSSLIVSNTTGGGGGGIGISSGVLELEHGTIYDNEATDYGGGIYVFGGAVAVSNSLIVSNTAVAGGGIYSDSASLGASFSDFFGNSPDHVADGGGAIDPATLGSDNRVTNPQFVDPQRYDLHIPSDSPAVDTGAVTTTVDVDYEGEGRPFGAGVDRGGDEYTAPGDCYARLDGGRVYTDVQMAVDAGQDGSLVQVAGYCSGVGVRGGFTQTVYVSRSLTLRGGYTATDWAAPRHGPTVLDAQELGRVVYVTGTAMITPLIENLHIANGRGDYGAGIYVGRDVNATLRNDVIYWNEATADGGAVYNQGSTFLMQHNTIYSNTASRGGGVFASGGLEAGLENNLVVGNVVTAPGGGGGVYAGDGEFVLSYNDFYANTSGGNPDDYGNATPGATDVSVPPGFVNPDGGDFHLALASPVINEADPASALSADFEGDGRPRGTRSDIGADESRLYAEVDLSEAPTSPMIVIDLDQVRGKTVTFTHTITNLGDTGLGPAQSGDSIVITTTNSDGWTVTLSGISSPAVLPTGASQAFDVVVSVPATITELYDRTWITAASQANPLVYDVAEDVLARPGVAFSPDYTENADPGEIVTYTHTLTNTGHGPDTFSITVSSSLGWGQLITPTAPIVLGSGETASVVARARVTDTAPANLADVTTLRATSSFSTGIFAVVTDTTIANPTIGDRFVATEGDDTNNNCTQEELPCATIAYAVGQAAWGDTVVVAQGTYSGTDIFINQDVSLRGGYEFEDGSFSPPAGGVDPSTTVIDAQGGGRALRVQVPSGFHPLIEGFTIRNAASSGVGGAVYVQASSAPSLTELIISDSSATRGGGIYIEAGAPTLQNVTISGTVASDRGGGLYVGGGSPIIESVTISNATAVNGGGVYVAGGEVSIQGLQVAHSVADERGGGVYHADGTLSLWNSFIYRNTAGSGSGGGVYVGGGTLDLVNDTLYDNCAAAFGGGVADEGSSGLVISNTIVVTNAATAGGGVYRDSVGSLAVDYNDFWGNEAASFPDSNVFTGTRTISADPLFVDAAAGDLHLSSTSPCVDAADPDTFLTSDIDGDLRPVNQGFDIGADELGGCLAQIERTGVMYGVLQEALDAAVENDVIQVSGVCRGVQPRLVDGRTISQTAFITGSLVLEGGYNSQFSNDPASDPVTTVLDAQGLGRVVVITGPVSATVSYLTLTGGDAMGLGGGPGGGDAGGGMYSYVDALRLEGGVITGNQAAYGGGFYNVTGTLTLAARIASNTATYGGGLYLGDGLSTLANASFVRNTATQGGGLYNAGASAGQPAWAACTVTRTRFYSNTADAGGGVYNASGLWSGEFITAAYNSAATGGGMYNADAAHLSLQGGVLLSNAAGAAGGGVYNAATGVLTVVNTIVASNTVSSGDGGGLCNLSGDLTLRHGTLYANSAGGQGGGMYHDADTGSPVINSTLIVDNAASDGSGMYSAGAAPSFDYNDVYGNDSVGVAGVGNISADPDFLSVDPMDDDFLMLSPGSSAEDVADPHSPVDVDIDGDPRPSNRGFDIGADEVSGCYVRVNGQPPTYGSVQVAVGRAGAGDLIQVAGTCRGANAFVDGGQAVSQTVFLTRSLAIRGGYSYTNWTVPPDPITYPTALDALALGRVVYITNSAVISVSDLHMRGGNAVDGGAIFVGDGVLTMTGNLVYSNTATNGGGLYNYSGTSYVDGGNEFFANSATNGGALYHADGVALVQNTIIRDNQAADGGGVYNDGDGLTVWHNTVYANSATNGGGLYTTNGSLTVVNNIFIANTATTGHAIHAPASLAPDYNDVYPVGSAYGGGVSAGFHSLSVDPLLVDAPGGDFHLQDDSPVIDRGDPGMPLVHDFEGDLRPGDQGFDMGADERASCRARVVRTGVVYGNVQRAVDHSVPGDVIQVTVGECRGVHPYDDGGGTGDGTQIISQTVHLTHELTLHGGFSLDFSSGGNFGPGIYPDPDATTLDPEGLGRAILVGDGVSVTMKRFILVNGDATDLGGGPGGGDAGGAFYYEGSHSRLEHVDFYSSMAAYGGALFNAGTDFNMHNSWINNNTASVDGGAIYNVSGDIAVTVDEQNEGTRVYSNVAGARGGGIYNDSGTVWLLDNNLALDPVAAIALNQADQGGFLYNNSGQVYVQNNTIFENSAAQGGAFYNAGDATLDRGNEFYDNSSDGDGGAIYNTGVLTAWNTLIYENTAADQGAGVYNASGDSSILHNTLALYPKNCTSRYCGI